MTKEDVRELARSWGIPVWDRPATACLSSRFPYGTPVTAQGLRMVDDAERVLRDCGFTQLRIRHHDEVARIELEPDQLSSMLRDAALQSRVASELAALGYRVVTLDLHGFRSGSLNEVLGPAASTDLIDIEADSPHRPVPLATERRGPTLVVRMQSADVTRLADPDVRASFVEQSTADAEIHYVALSLGGQTGPNGAKP